jgi:AsmA family
MTPRLKKTIIFTSVCFIAFGIAIAILLSILDDDDYRWMAQKIIHRWTGYDVAIEGQFIFDISLAPSLSASDIQFKSITDGAKPPPIESIGHVDLQIGLLPALRGAIVFKHLAVNHVAIKWDVGGAPDRSFSGFINKWSDIEFYALESLSLKNISLEMTNKVLDAPVRTVLSRLEIDGVEDTDLLLVNGDGLVNGEGFGVKGRLGPTEGFSTRKGVFPIDIDISAAKMNLNISGGVDNTILGKGLNLRLAVVGDDISRILRLSRVDIPLAGRLNLDAIVKGDVAAPEISDLKMAVSDGSRFKFTAKGAIANLATGHGTDIALFMDSLNPEFNRILLPRHFSDFVRLAGTGRLRKSEDGFMIKNLNAVSSDPNGVAVSGVGWLQFRGFEEALELKAIDLNLQLSADSAGHVKSILFSYLPDQGAVNARARLKGPTQHLAIEDLVFNVGRSDQFQLQWQGRIGRLPFKEDKPMSGIDLTLQIDARESKLISSMFGLDLPELGITDGSARFMGSQNDFQVQHIAVHAQNSQGMKTEINGQQTYTAQDNGALLCEMAFDILIEAPRIGAAGALFGEKIFPGFGPVRAAACLSGTNRKLSLEDIRISAGKPGDLSSVWEGRIGHIPTAKDQRAADVEIFQIARGKNIAKLSSFIDFPFPDLGPFEVTFQVYDHQGIYGLKDVDIKIGSKKSLFITAGGEVDSLVRGTEPDLKGIRLRALLHAPHTGGVFKIFDTRVPDLGELAGRFSLVGDANALSIAGLKLKTRSSTGLNVSATGKIDRIGIGKALSFNRFDIKAIANAPDVRLLPGLTDLKLPDLGPMVAEARIKDRDNSLEFAALSVRTGPEKRPIVLVDGKAYQDKEQHQIGIGINFTGESAPWVEKYFGRFLPEIQRINGKFEVTSDAGSFKFKHIQLSTPDPQRFYLKADGEATKQNGSWHFNGRFSTEALDPSVVEAILNSSRALAEPMSFTGRLKGRPEKLSIDGDMLIGRSSVNTKVDVVPGSPRPKIAAEVICPRLYLEDFGILAPESVKKTPEKEPAVHRASDHMFGRAPIHFEWLKEIDLDLTLKADHVIGRKRSLDRCDVHLSIADGRLELGPAKLTYANGYVSVDADIDAGETPPQVTLNIVTEDLDAEILNLYFRHPWVSEGLLNLAADLESSGNSPHALADNLSGEIGIAMENGKVLRIVDMIGADAIDLVTLLPRITKYRDLNCMALQVELKEGVGTSQTFILDTPDARARAKASVDLGAETLDIVIQPGKKGIVVGGSSPMRIYGSLTNPKVKKIPLIEAARLIGEILMPYYFLPARALGFIWSLIKEDSQGPSPCMQMEP